MLTKQSKKDLRIISSDGIELMAHRVVVGLFSNFFLDLFLSLDETDAITSVMVPVGGKEVGYVLNVLYDETELGRDVDNEAFKQTCSVLEIDLSITGNFENKLDYQASIENSIYEPEQKEKILLHSDPVLKEEKNLKDGKVKTPVKKFSRSHTRYSDPSLNFSCDKCKGRFKRSSSLKKHELVEHQIEISCEACASIFMDFKAYQKHTEHSCV
jgi:hypothetical protein